MNTIVMYRDDIPPRIEYPRRIISPTKSSKCCITDMLVKTGEPFVEERANNNRFNVYYTTYQYVSCKTCGFTVRYVISDVPADDILDRTREMFKDNKMTRGL